MPKSKSRLPFFRSMKLKIVSIFVLLMIAVIVIIGTFLFSRVSNFYYDNFSTEMENAFSGELAAQLQEALAADEPVQKIDDVLQVFSAPLGIDSFRNYFVLDATGNILAGSDLSQNADLFSTDYSPNLISAMTGVPGNAVNKGLSYMDYAYPLVNGEQLSYIIYIQDDKYELNGVIHSVFGIILQALLLGILISVIFGFFLSNTITTPIANLTKKAQRIASGDFEHTISVKSQDEIGQLTNSFNYMANELKLTLDETSNEKNKMETILHNMADGVIAFDPLGNIIHINPVASHIFGINDVRHNSFDDIFSPLDGGLTLYDLLYLKPDATVEKQFYIDSRYIKAIFAPFTTEKQKVTGVIVVLQDVTIAQRLDNSRREFVANVSHELRTPLTTVKSYIETIIDSKLSDPSMAMHFLSVIDQETDRMTRLIKDLLTLSRLDYTAEVPRSRMSVNKLLQDVVAKLSIEAKNAGLSIYYQNETSLPPYYGDRDRLEQVFSNIVSNAIKYTPAGGRISVTSSATDDVIFVRVADTGIGIPKKDLPRIFERFYRVDKGRSRERGGTGLGLAIAKEIVEKFGGNIRINSEMGSGTEVTISLPVHYK